MPLMPVPMFGSGVAGKSFVVTRQRRVNCYYEVRPDGDKSKAVVYGSPGLGLKFNLKQPADLPIRALLGVNEINLYALQYNNFLSLDGAGNVLFSAPINTIAGLASMAVNPAGTQIVTVDGTGGWVYQPGPNTFTALAASGTWFTPGAQTITSVGGYFVTDIPNSGTFGVSNVNDATAGSPLSFGAAAAFPDIVEAVDNANGNLVVFCQQHLEFWQPVGTPPPSNPFAPIQSATIQWGLAALYSRGHIDNALFFLGESTAGTRRVCRIDGYAVVPISEEIDWILNQKDFVFADATALTYQQDKHPFYQLTFPTMRRSFTYDCSTGIWNEAQSGLSVGPYERHTGNLSTYFDGETLVTDYATGNVYTFDNTRYTDNGQTVLREVITRHQMKGNNRFRIPQLYLDMETGVGLASGQGKNPVISIEVSKDNGRTWLAPRLVPIGAIGKYLTRVNARRFGQARRFTFRFRMTDPVKFVITDGAIRTKMRRAA